MSKRFISEEELLTDSYKLGVNVANSGFHPTVIVGLWRGGSSVGIYVQECLQYLGINTDHIAIRTSYRGLLSYQHMVDNPEQEIRVHGTQYLLENLNADDGLLIVDDVFSSGLNTRAVINRLSSRLKKNMPRQVRIATPWYKPTHNRTDHGPDYYLHTTDKWLVMPYELSGLSPEEISEHKNFIVPILESLDQPL
ncbi:MAG: hypoxanthine phosphoribosyltransferase [Gammaproteobacteria bacterium]|nr:hypoxanthine phosphoribosyltransferase [Gammaproteobacteria bacterium]